MVRGPTAHFLIFRVALRTNCLESDIIFLQLQSILSIVTSNCLKETCHKYVLYTFFEYQPSTMHTVWQLHLFLTQPDIADLEQDSSSNDEDY